VASFVGPPWIFHLCLGIGVGATISWGGIDVKIEPRGAESRSILPRYVSRNRTACVSDIPIMWNPLHSHMLRSKTKTSRLSSTTPSRYHFRHRYTNLPQIVDTKDSNGILYTPAEVLYHYFDSWVDAFVNLHHVNLFGGEVMSFWKVKFTSMREDRDNCLPINVSVYHRRSCVTWDGATAKSFTVLLQVLAIRWVSEYFVEVGAWIWAAAIQIANIIIKRQWYISNAWEGCQKTSISTP